MRGYIAEYMASRPRKPEGTSGSETVVATILDNDRISSHPRQVLQMPATPNILVAGFAKCGTTSLARYLADHPDIASPPVKEVYAYVDEGPLQSYRDEIASAIPQLAKDGRRYRLDATPFYYCQNAALKFAENTPDCRVVFITREPISRLVSSYRFFSEMYQEFPSATFSTFISSLLSPSESARFQSRISKPFFKYLYSLELEMGRYATHIQRWQSILPAERIAVISMERMRSDPLQIMKDLCRFLKVDAAPYSDYHFTSFMRSYSVRSKFLQRWLRKIGGPDLMRYSTLQEYHNPFHFARSSYVRKVGGVLLRVMQKTSRTYELESWQTASLQKYYRADNISLLAQYGIDYTAGRSA